MRKAGVFAAVIAVIATLLWGQVIKGRQVLLNGKPFATAEFLNGQWAVPLQDFAKAGGGTMTLEPNFQLRGSSLIAVSSTTADAKTKIKWTTTTKNKVETYRAAPGSIFHVQNGGVISSRVFMANGKTYLPLADIVHAFGVANFTAPAAPGPSDTPAEAIHLNFTKIEHSYLTMN